MVNSNYWIYYLHLCFPTETCQNVFCKFSPFYPRWGFVGPLNIKLLKVKLTNSFVHIPILKFLQSHQRYIFFHFALHFFSLFSFLPFHHWHCALLPLCSLVKGKCLGTVTGRFIIYFLDQPCMLVARSDGTPETMASEQQPHHLHSCFIHFDFTKAAWNIQSQADDVSIRRHGNGAAFRKKGK